MLNPQRALCFGGKTTYVWKTNWRSSSSNITVAWSSCFVSSRCTCINGIYDFTNIFILCHPCIIPTNLRSYRITSLLWSLDLEELGLAMDLDCEHSNNNNIYLRSHR